MISEHKIENYNFILPKVLVAQEPSFKRSSSRLLFFSREKNKIFHLTFDKITDYLDDNYCLVLNNSKVENRKLNCRKDTGAEISLIITSYEDNKVKVLFTPFKKIRLGQKIIFPEGLELKIDRQVPDTGEFILVGDFDRDVIKKILSIYGLAPLPPYIKRNNNDLRNKEDLIRYQTVYAKDGNSIAAPTAGLHFDKNILDILVKKGIKIVYIKLNIGISTFKKVNVEYITQHKMFPELAEVDEYSANIINDCVEKSKKILCVGTTTVRTLEFLVNRYRKVVTYNGLVDNFIYPPYKFKIVNGIITNFHLPKSTNLVLVSAFVGREKLLDLYKIAIKERYRFYSYGDAMLIL